MRGIGAMLGGNFIGKLQGDGFQMPGVFLIKDGEVIKSFIHKTAADRPDYLVLAACNI